MKFSIDEWLLERTQSLSALLQEWIGGDNFVYARVLFRVGLVLIALRAFLQEGTTPVAVANRLIIDYLVAGVVGLIGLRGEMEYRRSPVCINPNEWVLKPLRLISLILLGLSTVVLYLHILAIAADESTSLLPGVTLFVRDAVFSMYLYFASCTPLPPKPKENKVPKNLVFQGA